MAAVSRTPVHCIPHHRVGGDGPHGPAETSAGHAAGASGGSARTTRKSGARRREMTKHMTREADMYYDPYDFEIDVDPYPTFRRLRDDAPLYYNEKYDFFALSRHEDVKKASVDWATYKSGHGTILEFIKGGMSM